MKSMIKMGLGLAMLTLGSLSYVMSDNTYEVAPLVAVPIVCNAEDTGATEVVDTTDVDEVDETEILAEVCMGEAGNQPLVGKVAVIVTIINRANMYGMTIEEVVTEERQYNGYPYRGIISNECYDAVEIARKAVELEVFPKNMIYFRTGKYHSFGKPYTQIGDHYFSVEPEDTK